MSAINLSEEVMREIRRLTEMISTSTSEELQAAFDKVKENMELPAVTTKGSECGGCVSCGACPITHIKAGYLLTALHLS